MKVLDLFAGLRGWSTTFGERGHEVFTVDFDPRFGVTLHADILKMTPDDLPWRPDIVLASPPCEGFSVMNIGRNWTRPTDDPPHQPKSDAARMALQLVEHTLWLIDELQPTFFIIENPRAKLRALPVVAALDRVTVWYCHYGETTAKPTDLWGGFPAEWIPRPPCHSARAGHPAECCCADHVAAPRGSRAPGSIQGMTGPNADADRARVPDELSTVICIAAEKVLGPGEAEPVIHTHQAHCDRCPPKLWTDEGGAL